MGSIRVLEETVASQIAAGEIVERPVSVVKELLENSLDAGASRIDIEIDAGGADRVRVADDGSGMDREDAARAFERHATSKVRRSEDLKAILTFGFRGEALPSIASVSRTTLTTSTGAPAGGCRVRVHGGKSLAIDPASHPRGTTVEVEALFYNAPARRKFLKAPSTETAHIADLVTRIAAAHPAIAFSLRSGGRDMLTWPPVGSHRERVLQILGPDQSASLLEVQRSAAATRLTGLASGPDLQRSTARDLVLFVNGRPIRDRRLLHAIGEAYVTLLPRGRYPLVYLFLEVPPEEVDVNVHPAKTEVRFLRAGAIHDLVRDALRDALGVERPFYRASQEQHAVAEPVMGRSHGPESEVAQVAVPALARTSEQTLLHHETIVPLAQFYETYIVASGPDGLVILDQHAAHERVLYERILARTASGRTLGQRLLFPVLLEVSPRERQASEDAAPVLEALGFGLTGFGPGTLRIDEVPAIAPATQVERLVRDGLAEIMEWNRAEGMDRLRERIAASAACHSAVRARQHLDLPQMRQIAADLMRSVHPMTCPHGRPTLLKLSLEALERDFRRR